MALEIKNKRIVGTINDIHSMNGIGLHDKLDEKLEGKLPITREELLVLVNSWGRINFFYTEYLYEDVKIEKCEATQSEQAKLVRKECYDLSRLDTSNINDMSEIFKHSQFNGDISNWNVGNVTNMRTMFFSAYKFNQALDNWDVSKVTNMNSMFCGTKKFNQNINSWNIENLVNVSWMFFSSKSFNQTLLWDLTNINNANHMFDNAIAFETKFNNGNPLPSDTNNLKQWLKENNDKKLESTPEYKIAIIEYKIAIIEKTISNNKTTLDDLFREKNIDPNSKIGLELLKVYNDTHDKLNKELEDLNTQVVDIATNDFNSI